MIAEVETPCPDEACPGMLRAFDLEPNQPRTVTCFMCQKRHQVMLSVAAETDPFLECCGRRMLRMGYQLMSNPPMNEFKCVVCGKIKRRTAGQRRPVKRVAT